MDVHNREIALVQNPAIGALAMWHFTSGYYSLNLSPVPFPLLFIVLPIVFRSELREVIVHTYKSSGLTKIIEKLGNQKNVDQLYSIHFSAENYKLLSLQSIHIAEATQLVFVEKETAKIFPLLQKPKKMDNLDSQKIVDAAEKLGIWCSNMTIHEIGNLLKVRF